VIDSQLNRYKSNILILISLAGFALGPLISLIIEHVFYLKPVPVQPNSLTPFTLPNGGGLGQARRLDMFGSWYLGIGS
jgi:hypothetical protein